MVKTGGSSGDSSSGALLSVRRRAFEEAARQIISERRSVHTRTAYSADLDRWLRFAYAMGVSPESPSVGDAAKFRDALFFELSDSSVRRVLAALSSIFRRLLVRGLVKADPFHPELVEWPAYSDVGRTPAVEASQAERMIEAAKGSPRDKAILCILRETGLRRSSVASLRRDSIDDRGKVMTARVALKGNRVGEVTFPSESASAIRAWLRVAPSSPFLFPAARDTSRPIHPNRVNDVVDKYADDVSPHGFRAAFATESYDAKLPEREIQAAMHHQDSRTTQRYDRHKRGGNVPLDLAKTRKKS